MSQVHSARFQKVLPLLVCPRCRHELHCGNESLYCQACKIEYPIVAGRPVFVPAGRDVRVMPEDHVSNQAPGDVVERATWEKGWVLDLGAGGTLRKIENVVELEYALFKHTDVSADAHHLPFADNTFEAVYTFNTFEHLMYPPEVAAEIYRVLKPGGWLFLHTAFMQPLHESPYHFYNTTEWGLRKWFQKFDIQDVTVPGNFSPSYSMAFLASMMLHQIEALGPEVRRLVGQSTLDYWASAWVTESRRSDFPFQAFLQLPQEHVKASAAGYQLEATKPK